MTSVHANPNRHPVEVITVMKHRDVSFRQPLRNFGFALLATVTLGTRGWTTMVCAHPSNGIAVEESGAVVFADERRNIVFRIDPAGKLNQWVTGKHSHELFLDLEGNLYGEHLEYIPEQASWRSSIWRRGKDGQVMNVYGPSPGFAPGLLLDGEGNRYSSNSNERLAGAVSVITKRTRGGHVTVLAGGSRHGGDGQGESAQLGRIVGMAWGPGQTLYFIEDDAVRRVTRDGVVTTLARGFRGAKDPDLPDQRLWGLTVDRAGVAWVADHGNRRVVKVTREGEITTVLRAEKPWSPTGVALGGATLFVLEHGFEPPTTSLGPRVRKLQPQGSPVVLVTVADPIGSGKAKRP